MRGEGAAVRATRFSMAVLAVALTMTPTPALAGNTCDATFNPSPGWRGASVHVFGDGYAPNDSIAVYVNLMHAVSGSTDSEGAFDVTWNVPNDFPVGTHDFLVFDGFGWCDVDGSYTVNAGPPTTTTSSTTTTSTTSTTSSTTTTSTTTTTTLAPATTTSIPDETTTTAPAESDGGGGLSAIVWILLVVIAILIGIVGYQFGVRRRSG